jgi:hypothetical protein
VWCCKIARLRSLWPPLALRRGIHSRAPSQLTAPPTTGRRGARPGGVLVSESLHARCAAVTMTDCAAAAHRDANQRVTYVQHKDAWHHFFPISLQMLERLGPAALRFLTCLRTSVAMDGDGSTLHQQFVSGVPWDLSFALWNTSIERTVIGYLTLAASLAFIPNMARPTAEVGA